MPVHRMPHEGTLRLASLALLSLAMAACGREARLEPIRAEEPLLELLAHPELLTVVREDPARPVRQDLMKPRGSGQDDFGAFPALELTPPAEVQWRVPATFSDAVLRFAFAVESGSYLGTGRVRFELELDGRPLLARELPCGEDLPREERRWHRLELPIGAGGLLALRTSYEGDQTEPPTVGVGLLRVVVPFDVERQRTRADAANVLLVLIDTLRADRLHSYGNPRPVSPAMDGLAARGMRFERAYSSAAWTIPSTASVLTGASPPEHGLGCGSSYYLADALVTVAEAFQRAGFTTGGFAANPLISPSRNFAQGFETFREYSWPRGDAVDPDVARWLEAHAGERFFLYLHLVDPHYPYEPPEALQCELAGAPPPGYVERELEPYLAEFYADPSADLELLRASAAHQLELYDAEIAGADAVIGRLLAKLTELGLAERTIVAVTSDHGEEFLEHGWAGHHNQLFDEQVRVPLILAGPGVPVGIAELPVENRLLASTLLRLADVEAPPSLRAPSLVDPLDAAELSARPVFFTNSKGRSADLAQRTTRVLGQIHGAIEDGWRLVWSPASAEAGAEELVQLYELARDPDCTIDVAARHPERVEYLKERVRLWIAESQDRRPDVLPADGTTLEMLREIGYVADEQ